MVSNPYDTVFGVFLVKVRTLRLYGDFFMLNMSSMKLGFS